MYRTLRMVRGIFHPFDRGGFKRLIFIGKFFDAFVGRVFDGGKLLGVTGLAAAFRPGLASSVIQFIHLRLIVPTSSLDHKILLAEFE